MVNHVSNYSPLFIILVLLVKGQIEVQGDLCVKALNYCETQDDCKLKCIAPRKDGRIHPVFHVSLLKAFVGDPTAVEADPLPIMGADAVTDDHKEAAHTPFTILDSRYVTTESGLRREVLVQWRGSTQQDASWEDWHEFSTHYNLEDEVVSEEQGDDTDREKEATGQRRSARAKYLPKHWDDYQLE
ncbi:hypothetical protein D0Y65_034535 [Glycine soja]|uniref:Chromo domain-containing protein n=1 Tax=Glycine soja TaxID=3848 RepID=A0A445HQY3_GLYSO|nr:hypothetical protein D0Y65_034535 [Glycine soja]